jgi:diadenosine tetraphosphate (Ap4A) HIT family hydrolase
MSTTDCPFCRKLATLTTLPTDELVADLPYSVVLLGPWQYYHGYCIVVARRHATELSQLDDVERRGYFDDMCRTARAIEACFHPAKLNYELLGNQVPHLHWHLFPRYLEDPERLQPVWLTLDRTEHITASRQLCERGPQERAATADALRTKLKARV